MTRTCSALLLSLVALALAAGRAPAQAQVSADSPDKARVAKAEKETITVSDVKSGKILMKIKAHKKDVSALAYAPDGKVLVSADGDGEVCFFDAATGRMVRKINAAPGVNKLEFSRDGRDLTAKAPGATRKFDVATGKELK
jgi:WD40 repeat protein